MTIETTGHNPPRSRKEQILDVARSICLKEGLGAMTMRRVADEIGISATAIYRHYPDKAALVKMVINEANHRLGGYLRHGMDAPDPWSRFQGTLDALQQFALSETSAYEVLFFLRGRTDPDHLPLEMRSPNFGLLIDRVRECIHTGAMPEGLEPASVAITVWAQAHGLIALHLQGRFGGDETVFRRTWHTSMDHLFDGLRREPS